MLSICIPIFNIDITSLVQSLILSANKADIVYEIYCIDDGSIESIQETNKSIIGLQNVHYEILKKNIGRSRIRNLLAQKANHKFLLFLDCDSYLQSEEFVLTYIKHIEKYPASVISGGRLYDKEFSKTNEYYLHWLYGTKVESQVAERRNKKPYTHFHSNNFIVSRSILRRIPFDESITQYGHEDSLWARQVELNKVDIMHIDNAVIHHGLENNLTFLRKTSEAVENLCKLHLAGKVSHVKTQHFFCFLKLSGLLGIFYFFYKIFEKKIVQQLLSKKANLHLLSLYKLGIFIRFYKKYKQIKPV